MKQPDSVIHSVYFFFYYFLFLFFKTFFGFVYLRLVKAHHPIADDYATSVSINVKANNAVNVVEIVAAVGVIYVWTLQIVC